MKNQILNHKLFIDCLNKNKLAELGRIFCLHNMNHFLDVARLGMIINYKEKIEVEEELIYAAALLHDIGRFKQYADQTPHEMSSAQIAQVILQDCGADEKTTDVIVNAIRNHRTKSVESERSLNGILYRADKMSRICFACEVEKECHWKEEKKNKQLQY